MVHKIDGNHYYEYTNSKKVEIPQAGEKFDLGGRMGESSPELKGKKEEFSGKDGGESAEREGVRLEISSGGRFAGAGAQAGEKAGSGQRAKVPGTDGRAGQASLLETVREFFARAAEAVREFFRAVWNDPQAEGAGQEAGEELKRPEGEETVEDAGAFDERETGEGTDIVDGRETGEGPDISQAPERSSSAGLPAVIGPGPGRREQSPENGPARLAEEFRDQEIRRQLQKGNIEQAINILTDNGRKTVARNSTLLTSYDKNGRVVQPNASVRARTLYGDRHTRKL